MPPLDNICALNNCYELHDLIDSANQSFASFVYDKNTFNYVVAKAFDHMELLRENEVLLSAWKDLSLNVAKYLDLPFNSQILKAIKQINAYISQQPFFPKVGWGFCNDLFKPIVLHLDDHISYFSPLSQELASLACVSKKWNASVHELQNCHVAEHVRLKEQVNLSLNAGYETAKKAVDFMIKEQLEVAHLKKFPDLTEELLEKLFEGAPNLKHLIVESNFITKLPKKCSQLETLQLSSCKQLKSLPDMPWLKSLNCRLCENLESLQDMPKLIDFDCTSCIQLESLPVGLTNLKSLNCASSINIKSLPSSLTQLISLECDNFKLNTLEEFVEPKVLMQLTHLSCKGWSQLKSLPECLTQLKSLECNSCIQLKILPECLTRLIKLSCGNCPELKSFPDLPQLKKLTCLWVRFSNLEDFIPLRLLRQLTSLQCNGPEIKHLPDLPQLISLDCSACPKLESLPNLTRLVSLDCSDCCELKRLPHLPQLTSFTCNAFHLYSLEEFIPNPMFMHITHVNCNFSKELKSLPDLPQLTSLSCKNSYFNSLEDFISIKLIKQLKYLNCSYCSELKSLPELPQLKRLDCVECPNLKIQPGCLPKGCSINKLGFAQSYSSLSI